MGGPLKVVVAGPFGAGKTTLVKAVSQSVGWFSERPMRTPIGGKADTTVAAEFGRVDIESDEIVYDVRLFGSPGQERFAYMLDVVAEGLHGVLLVVDGTDIASLGEAVAILEEIERTRVVPLVIGVNKIEGTPWAVDEVGKAMSIHESVPVVGMDARDPASVRMALEALVAQMVATDGGVAVG